MLLLRHIHNWVLFLLWLRLFILSGIISPLISSSILGTYWLGKFIFQCPVFLPFHTVHGVFKARILKGLPFPSPVDHILSDLPTMTRPSWVALHSMACSFIELDNQSDHQSMWSDWLFFCDCGFQSVWPLMEKIKRLMEASLRERLTEEETVLMGGAMLSKSLIQISVDGWSCVPSLLFTWGQTMVD